MNSDSIPKRRRVAKACTRCRNLKVKCDGKTPICTRCHNYGYECAWSDQTTRSTSSIVPASNTANDDSYVELASLRSAIHLYDELLQTVQERVATGQPMDAASLGICRDQIKSALPATALTTMKVAGDSTPSKPQLLNESSGQTDHPIVANRFVGVASDLHFFNVIKRSFVVSSPATGSEQGKEDFEQYDLYVHEENLEATLAQVPDRAIADQLIETYFTTIHIAYPFLCRPSFMRKYELFWLQGAQSLGDPIWSAQLHTIFAIGLYYQSFLRKSGEPDAQEPTHEHHFVRASALQARRLHESSLSKVHLLLVQCFYMLATGMTDRCFVALGFAIRLSQSIGLHTESLENVTKRNHSLIRDETERRTWYSLFVLDRLLMLQLGRPSAIHDGGYLRVLPTTNDDSTFDLDNDIVRPLNSADDATQPGMYFLAVIEFSGIIGRVFQNLYAPAGDKQEPALMFRTMEIDQQLSAWKLRLNRVLRFDLGHTFDRCLIYRRQRNALAMKYHHLRAIIHRPYLCVLHIRHNEPMYMKLLETYSAEVKVMEQRAIDEARSTARLLHTIQNVEELVHDFPWWQMISCLVCASSMLVMAAVCSVCKRTSRGVNKSLLVCDDEDLVDDPSGLDADAEICLNVFDALSVHSRAAGRARDMLERLKTSGSQIQSAFYQYQADGGLEVVFPQGENVDHLLQGMPFETFDWDFELGLINTTQSGGFGEE